MPDRPTHPDDIYAYITIGILLMSIIGGLGYYIYQRGNVHTATPLFKMASSKPVTLSPSPASLNDQPIKVTDTSMLKFAIPHDATAYVVDAGGNKTGMMSGTVMNAIPLSEYAPDKIAGTVNWILIEQPSGLPYSLVVSGVPEKAIAIYAKNEAGYEGLELIDVSPSEAQSHTYVITLDKLSAQEMIKIQ
jgi:hypothetical protein